MVINDKFNIAQPEVKPSLTYIISEAICKTFNNDWQRRYTNLEDNFRIDVNIDQNIIVNDKVLTLFTEIKVTGDIVGTGKINQNDGTSDLHHLNIIVEFGGIDIYQDDQQVNPTINYAFIGQTLVRRIKYLLQ